MKINTLIGLRGTAISVGILFFAITLCAEPQDGKTTNTKNIKAGTSKPKVDDLRVDAVVARDRATQMHEIYSATLDVIHRRYFHGDRTAIPARAMEDIFEEMKHRSKIEARWISVNTKAMSIDHDPKTDFENEPRRSLVKALRRSKSSKTATTAVRQQSHSIPGASVVTKDFSSRHRKSHAMRDS